MINESMEETSLGELLDSWIEEGPEHDDLHCDELSKLLKENPIHFTFYNR